MSILREVGNLLGTVEGSLVYYLLILWAALAGAGMAWSEWRRARHELIRRLVVAMLSLVFVRVLYVVAALVSRIGWIEPAVLLPPMERFADTVSLGMLAWAVLPLSVSRRAEQRRDFVTGGSLAAVALVCGLFIFQWNRAWTSGVVPDYNKYWQASAWAVIQSAYLLAAGYTVLRDRGQGWGFLSAASVILLAGRFLQVLLPTAALHLPVWDRLANLLAYPLIAVAIYQTIVAGLHSHSRELQDISQASLDQIKSLIFLFEASRKISSSLDLAKVLDNAVSGMARALDADQCAIAFPEEGDPGQMRLVAIHNPTRQGRGEAVTFPLDYQLTVQQAMRRKRYILIEETDNVQVKVLFALLGSSETGPLLVQPLVDGEDVIGSIIVGNARSRRRFTPNEAKLCQSMAEQVVGAIRNARRHQTVQAQIGASRKVVDKERHALEEAQDEAISLRGKVSEIQAELERVQHREEAAREARNALEVRLASSRAEADSLAQRLTVLETDLAQAHANAEAQRRWHEDEQERLEVGWEQRIEAAERVRGAIHALTAGILVADAEGFVQEVNVATEILLDRGSDELEGMQLKAISDNDRWRQAVDIAADGQAVRLTLPIGTNTLMCDITPLLDTEHGRAEPTGIVVILQDISTEVSENRDRLDGIAAMIDELRTPMTTIISYADLLLSEAVGVLGDAQRKFVLRVKAGAERLVRMVGDLSQEAGVEEQWTIPKRQAIDLNNLIESAVAGAHVELENRSLALDLVLPDRLPVIEADPDYLRRILSNLLSNACLASAEGGRIHIQTGIPQTTPHSLDLINTNTNGDGYVLVSVKDAGGGLGDDALRRVFDRTRPSQTPPGLGESGAQLAMVKTLVEAHGGRIWVESQKGEGTVFSFVLPVREYVRRGFFEEQEGAIG